MILRLSYFHSDCVILPVSEFYRMLQYQININYLPKKIKAVCLRMLYGCCTGCKKGLLILELEALNWEVKKDGFQKEFYEIFY